MNPFSLPVRRPIATSMLFLGLFLLGWIAWMRIPVELVPPVSGEDLYVSFNRPGSEPEVVEREILLPLEARVAELSGVQETWAEVSGSGGGLTVQFESGTDIKVRELDLRRMAAELVREQPRGTSIDVDSQDLTLISRFAMFVQVTGLPDRNSLLDFVDQRVRPRLASVPGVSRVLAGGGAPRELTVEIDPDRCAAHGITPGHVTAALDRTVRRLQFLGGAEDEAGRTAMLLDGRPRGVISLGETRIVPDRPVLLRHVAEVRLGTGREEILFRVNGKTTVAMVVFQEEGANLIRLGRGLRTKLDELREEFDDFGLDFVINFDAAETVEEQLGRLRGLAIGGFLIALAVLFLFLRQFRAVGVVAVAVPASLLTALAFLYLAGQSINLITLFGLAVGIGMLVDNSIVVYEAVQRQLERGAGADEAAEFGVRRTVRAILAATTTNAVVFLPVVFADFSDGVTRKLLEVMALAILLPMLSSVLVAVGLVPLLARRLAAPAAMARIRARRLRRESLGGLAPPERVRELFGAMLVVALRRPTVWVTVVIAAVLLTVVIALPWVAVGAATQEPPEAQQVRFSVSIDAGQSLDKATRVFERIEGAVMAQEGIKLVESVIQEEGGSMTVHLLPKEDRPEEINAARIRRIVLDEAQGLPELEINSQQSLGGGGGGGPGRSGGGGLDALLGQAPSKTVLSGSDAAVLNRIANEIQKQLQGIPEVSQASIDATTGNREIRVIPQMNALEAYGLTADQVLPALSVVRREGVLMRTGFTLHDGREIPMTVRRVETERSATEDLRDLRLSTPAGVLPLDAVAAVRKMPPPPTILHHNGRREIAITHRLGSEAPKTGPARQALDDQITAAIQQVHRPAGYTIETPDADESFSWFKKILVPVVLLLFAVLALTFESLTLPLLVLVSLPLTVLGATWALVITDTPADYMALVGTLALIGLTVNPAILLVDRMQHRAWYGRMSAGAAALAAVRERARPVLMTATTTIAGLFLLAKPTGRENEIWPPFATVVMGGLVTSTILTLLVIPVGFVFLNRLDRLFGRLGPWIMIGWVGATAAVIAPLVVTDTISTMRWRIITTMLVAAALMGLAVLIFRRPEVPEPASGDGPPAVEVRYLRKVYGEPGPVGRAWRVHQRFAEAVKKFGGSAFDPREALERLLPLALVLAGALYQALTVRSFFWNLVFLLVAAAIAGALFRQIRVARGHVDELGRVHLGGPENVAAALMPWVALSYFTLVAWVSPTVTNLFAPESAKRAIGVRLWLIIVVAVIVLVVQLGRSTAVLIARGRLPLRVRRGTPLFGSTVKLLGWIFAWLAGTALATVLAFQHIDSWLWKLLTPVLAAIGQSGATVVMRLGGWRTMWRRFSRFCFGMDLPREQVCALAGVDFRAERGMVGVLGPNGAGKTTLLRMLAGILEPSTGRVYIGSEPIGRLKRYLARWVGYLPQDFDLPKSLTAREYLDYYALLYEIRPGEVRRERVNNLLEEVGLGPRADEKIGGYSGGMRQRVAVARTLLRLPPVIVVDEPTVGLDPRERIRFRNLLSRLSEGRVVLFSTHVVEDVEVACERVIVMARGRVVFDGQPLDLAAAAEGKVWVMSAPDTEKIELPEGARVVDQVPEGIGRIRSRILAEAKPAEAAEGVVPTLEDGYLWLVRGGHTV